MKFVYPKELQPGDRLRIVGEGKVWWEEVDSVTNQEDEHKRVMVFTKARMILCDPGDKVVIQRDAEQPVGE